MILRVMDISISNASIIRTRSKRSRFMLLWMIPAMLCLGPSVSVVNAQTLFQPYDTIPALSRYRSVEECLAAVSRVAGSAALARPEFPDTMPFRKGVGRDSTDMAAVAVAGQCATQFNPDSVVLTGAVETYSDWIQLYLTANRDDAAVRVVQRRVANARQHPKTPRDLYDVLMGIMGAYGDARPMRWDKVQETGVQLEAKGVAPGPMELYKVYVTQYQLAETMNDTVVQTTMAERMLSTAETMLPEVKNRPEFMFVRYMNFGAASFLTRAALMDSLRRGPEAYVALARANWKKVAESSMFPIPMMIGEKALPLTADFWVSSSTAPVTTTSDHPRPSPGKIALVVFLREGCNARTPIFSGGLDRATFVDSCWGTYTSLRRLAQRFPSLEITLVSRTMGYIGNTGPMSPQDEALVLQKWWLGFHKLSVTLAITNTQFFRLEGVDRRRIDQPVANDVNYLFGQGQGGNEVGSQMSYLIDTNGMVIYSGGLAQEWIFTQMLDVIMQRGK